MVTALCIFKHYYYTSSPLVLQFSIVILRGNECCKTVFLLELGRRGGGLLGRDSGLEGVVFMGYSMVNLKLL